MQASSVNADQMSVSQIRDRLNEGYSDIENGRVRPAREVFEKFKKGRFYETL